MIKLFNHELSGNSYKVRLMLSLLGLEYEVVDIDLKAGEAKSPWLLKMNPLGQIPILMDGDLVISDSHAILVYLARRYGNEDWLPVEAVSMSKVIEWLSISANEIQNGPCTARLYFVFNAKIDLDLAQQRAHAVLKVIDKHLQQQDWLVLNRPTIADIACYPYIGLAPEGGISLEAYPNVVAWINRIKGLTGYIGMPGL
ncbi:glutathione S-transferase [Chlorogloeopsis sp. ULAP01]|uniref:glutathione S-transferase family protein n=1 Tax=Chlorogloeopsis sp. ULAP01 TaxID=3056483 RepID=UPI0025AB0F22|nr:glutathione S-transferase [Chlorogloeopsis sp. ULAP01]MDM9384682.1 glutathione S-transferase [Chlorogloeopsis sp. ULAP01]